MLPFRWFVIFVWLLVIVAQADGSDDDSCQECLDQGCTYCANSAFNHPDACLCDEDPTGFFGGCSDASFGSQEFESKWDCRFDSQNGEAILAAIVIVPIVLVFCACCVYHGGCESLSDPSRRGGGMTFTSSSGGGTTGFGIGGGGTTGFSGGGGIMDFGSGGGTTDFGTGGGGMDMGGCSGMDTGGCGGGGTDM